MKTESENLWQSKARSVALHVNAGWWLHHLLLPSLIVSALASAAILVARANGYSPRPWAIGSAAVVLAIVALGYLRARRKFFSADDALVRIESNAKLNNRLTSAKAGVGAWPDYTAQADAGLRWNFKRILVPLAGSALCLVASLLIPVKLTAAAATRDMQEPTSWTQVQQWVDELKQNEVVQPKDLETIEEQLNALRKEPKEKWYGHNSLEAGDQLRDQTQQGIKELDRNLALADSVLSQAMKAMEQSSADGSSAQDGQNANNTDGKQGNEPGQKNGKEGGDQQAGLDQQQQEALSKAWQKALEGLKSGSLKPDAKTMSELSKIDPSKLKMVDAKTLKECKGKLAKDGKACGSCLGKGDGDSELMALVESMTAGNSDKPGQGGISRGRGDAPLTFNKDETTAKLSGEEAISNDDMRNASIGETIGVVDTKHQVDPSQYKAQTGGNAAAGGAGEAVWKTETLPDDQAALERYFSDKK